MHMQKLYIMLLLSCSSQNGSPWNQFIINSWFCYRPVIHCKLNETDQQYIIIIYYSNLKKSQKAKKLKNPSLSKVLNDIWISESIIILLISLQDKYIMYMYTEHVQITSFGVPLTCIHVLLFFAVEHVRLGPGGAQAANIKTKPKVFITDTRDMQLAGACVFFIKINPSKALTLANINQVIIIYTS